MPFQDLRAGSPLWILHKEQKPYIETAQALGPPSAKYALTPTQYNMPQEMAVDIQVKVGETTINYQKLPAANSSVNLGNNSILACSKEAILLEVISFRQLSKDALSQVKYHKDVITACNEIEESLNPEIAERKKQEAENKALREEVAELRAMFADFLNSQKATNTKKA